MFTAWYGLIPYIKQITFRLLKVNDLRIGPLEPLATMHPMHGTGYSFPPDTAFYIFSQQIYLLYVSEACCLVSIFSCTKCLIVYSVIFCGSSNIQVFL